MASERDEVLLTHEGKIRQLEQTIETANVVTEIHESEQSELDQLRDLKNEINRLREVRDGLKVKAATNLPQSMPDHIMTELKARGNTLSANAIDPLQMQKKIWMDKKKRRIEELQLTHRLTGRTIFRLANGKYGIRFDTYFEGEFCDTFYTVLALDPTNDSKMIVYKHTIPYFIPIKKIEARFLNKNIKLFSDCLHDYLQAFSARKAMIQRIMKIDPNLKDIVLSEGYDYIQFRKFYRGYTLEVRLVFQTVRDILPSKCTVWASDAVRKQRIEKVERNFLSNSMHIAFKASFKEI